MIGPAILVEAPGLLATVQDRGRPGRAAQGIAPSGALDRGALALANRLLGNTRDAAALEITMGGFSAVLLPSGGPARGGGQPGVAPREADEPREPRGLWIALTGARGDAEIDGRGFGPNQAVLWPFGTRLRIGMAVAGSRFCLGVRGGVDAPIVAGSRSSDVLAGLGRPPLAPGDALAIAAEVAGPIPAAEPVPWGVTRALLEVALAPGPRADWFAPSASAALFGEPWLVSNDANRVGMRLLGPALQRVREGELPSEGMVVGAVQVPPSGLPTVLLADGPVTGGYPVIAVVAAASLDLLAQARPGERLVFRRALP
ncbi:MAG TPA: biotin-dependent carboxyltransferase family protein [Microbacteriaceae bacterium]|jgi:biotin-dependent carboxylase-like uncharacterized protein|nr:biotin-dependent carboxyltransferase family protein [Microbacteriaceae bacterium]HPZ34372.1 biotin-dependent carboxyltransferase family protein [Microbacteriaceae bacterium]HQC93095.1 biotin-dependent carboxyltransferase family protein [Microbacteriaceae bacterium]